MKKLQILIIAFLISLAISVFVCTQTVKAAATPSVTNPTFNPVSPIILGSSVTASANVTDSSGIPTGNVTFQYSIDSGSTWTNMSTVALVGGSATSDSYTPTASGSNYQFRAVYNGNVNYNSAIGASSTLTVNKAFVTVGAASFIPASPIILGSSVTVSVVVSGPGGVTAPTGNVQFQAKIGVGSYANFGSAVALSGGSASVSYTPQTVTTYNFQAVYQGDTNYNSGTTSSASGTLTVNKAAATVGTPTLVPSGSVTVGTSVSIWVAVSGSGAIPTGTATFQVNIAGGGWSNIGSAVSLSSGSASTTYVPQSAGSYQFQVVYSGDSIYNGDTSSAVSLTGNVGLTVSVSPVGPVTMDVGQSQLFTATVTGGIGTKSYQWYFDGAVVSGQTASTYSYLSVLGSHTIYFRVIDSTPVTVQSNTITVAGNSALTASPLPAGPLTMSVGQSQTFNATASGGTGTKSFQWYLDNVVVSGQTSSTYSYIAVLGLHSIYVTVIDSASTPVTFQSNAVSITVYSVLTVSVTPVSWTMDVGQSKLFTANPAGGSGSYVSYQWRVGGVVQSGVTTSTFSYVAGSAGSFPITVMVTDNLGTTSAQSSAASVTVAAAMTVSVVPTGPIKMDVGQVQVFTATPSGGSGVIHYQWYLGAGTVGTDNSTYSYTAVGTSASITCRVTDSASVPFMSNASNAVAITVNPALVAPGVFASLGVITQGQTSVLSNSSSLTTGTSPYAYQWFQKAPVGSYSTVAAATSNSYSFATSISTSVGTWSFILEVRDAAGVSVNSSAVSVTVNIPPLDHFIFSSIGSQTAGTSFSITITAKDSMNNTLTNYVGTNVLNVSIGTINPTSTGVFVSGVWTGLVTVTGAGSGVTLFTTGSGMSGTSGIFTVNPGALNRFTFSNISSPQTSGLAFSITVTAKDAYGNNVKGYVGSPSLTVSVGSVSPGTMNAFVNGVGSTLITVTGASSGVTITATGSIYSGISNSFTLLISPTPTPSPTATPSPTPTPTSIPTPTSTPSPTPEPVPTSTPTPISTSTSTSTPKATATPTPQPSPSPTPLETIVKAKTDSGATVDLAISGNVTSSQISNVTIATNQSAHSTTVSFTVTGESGTTGFSNMTIPKTAISYGKSIVVFIDGQQVPNQGYKQDANNFYIWYTTQFSTHEVTIQFVVPPPPATSLSLVLAVVIIAPEIILVYAVIAIKRLKRKPENT